MSWSDRVLLIVAKWCPVPVLIGFMVADLRIAPLSWSPGQISTNSYRIALAVVWIFGAISVAVLWRERSKLPRSTRLILSGLFLGTAISFLADDPIRSVVVGVGFVVVVASTATVTLSTGHDRAIRVLIGGLALVCTVSLALGLLQVSSAWEPSIPRRLEGVLVEPNSLGQFGGLLAVLCGAMWSERKLPAWIGAGGVVVGLTVATLSLTRTIGPALLVTLFVVGMLTRPKVALLAAASLSALFIAAIVAVGTDPFTELVDRGQGAEEISTLSNRLDLWAVSIDEIQTRPLTGHGFASGPRRFELALEQGRLPWIYSPSSHNLAMEIAREVGLPAFVLIGAGALLGASRRGVVMPAMLTYLASSAILMPTTGVPGTLVVAWTIATLRSAEPASACSDYLAEP